MQLVDRDAAFGGVERVAGIASFEARGAGVAGGERELGDVTRKDLNLCESHLISQTSNERIARKTRYRYLEQFKSRRPDYRKAPL